MLVNVPKGYYGLGQWLKQPLKWFEGRQRVSSPGQTGGFQPPKTALSRPWKRKEGDFNPDRQVGLRLENQEKCTLEDPCAPGLLVFPCCF